MKKQSTTTATKHGTVSIGPDLTGQESPWRHNMTRDVMKLLTDEMCDVQRKGVSAVGELSPDRSPKQGDRATKAYFVALGAWNPGAQSPFRTLLEPIKKLSHNWKLFTANAVYVETLCLKNNISVILCLFTEI